MTRDRIPLEWANSYGNQGVAMMLVADRNSDGRLAGVTIEQIQTAYETLRDGGQEPWAAHFQGELAKAHAIRDRIEGR